MSEVVADRRSSPPYIAILVVAGLIVIGAGVKATSIVAPAFLVVTLVITVSPLRSFLVRRRWPSPLASVVSLLAIYAMLILILGSVVYALARLVATLPQYTTALTRILGALAGLAARVGFGQEQITAWAKSLDLSSIAGPAQSVLSGVGGGLSTFLVITVLALFMAFEADSMGTRLDAIAHTRPAVATGLRHFAERVRRYWMVTTLFGLIVAILDVVGLAIIGVPLALTWGVLAFVTNYIPNIGFVLGVVPPALIALLNGGVGQAVAVIIVYVVLNVVIQTIIQPRFTGDAVGISATVAFLSLIFWAYVLGPLGAILAIPATLFMKSILLDNTTPPGWLNELVSSNPGGTLPKNQRRKR